MLVEDKITTVIVITTRVFAAEDKMKDSFVDIAAPSAPSSVLTPDQAIHGPLIPAQQQILLYSPDQWEAFTNEWVHFCLKPKYLTVQRFSGTGDQGIDIAGFEDDKRLLGIWDNFQCKHYDHPLRPSDVWAEFGKILWYSFKKEYKAPRKYYFVAPKGIGTQLSRLLANSEKLKAELIANWDKDIRKKIIEQEVPLEGEILPYVELFDFSIFDAKTGLRVIEDHRKCPYHTARFGGGLPQRPAAGTPPDKIAEEESKYIAQLLAAYADHKKAVVPNASALGAWPKLREHFGRQREAFYHAESLRVFARDTVPSSTPSSTSPQARP